MENGGPDAYLVSAWEENKLNALSHCLRRTFESFHRNFTFYLGLRYCGDLVLLIQDSTKSLIPRGRRRSLLYETRGIKQANFEIQRKTILTSHIFLHLRDFLTQVSILHCENKKTLLVYKSNQKNSKLNDKKQRRTGAIFTSSPPRTQLAVRAPCLSSCTTTFSFSNLHHLLCNSFTHVVRDDSEAKPFPRICKLKFGIKST